MLNAFRRFGRLLRGSRPLLRNIAVLAGGTSAAQIVGIAAAPIITRLYDPETFGVFGTFSAIVTVLAPFAGLALPVAIAYSRTSAERLALAKLTVIASAATALLSTIIIVALHHRLSQVLSLGASGHVLLLVPPTLFFAGLVSLGRYWLIAAGRFGVTARATVVHALALNLGQLLFGLVTPTPLALTGTYSGSLALHAFALHPRKPLMVARWMRRDARPLRETLRLHKDYPLYRAPQQLVNSVNQFLPIFALSALVGSTATGLYALSRLVVMAPSQLIGRSVLDAFSPELGTKTEPGSQTRRKVFKVTAALAVIGVLPFGLLAALGPQIFEIVFGDAWREAGEYARWLALWMYCSFVNRASMAAIPALAIQSWFLFYEVVSVLSKVAILPVAATLTLDGVALVACFSVLGAVSNAWLLLHVLTHQKMR